MGHSATAPKSGYCGCDQSVHTDWVPPGRMIQNLDDGMTMLVVVVVKGLCDRARLDGLPGVTECHAPQVGGPQTPWLECDLVGYQACRGYHGKCCAGPGASFGCWT